MEILQTPVAIWIWRGIVVVVVAVSLTALFKHAAKDFAASKKVYSVMQEAIVSLLVIIVAAMFLYTEPYAIAQAVAPTISFIFNMIIETVRNLGLIQ